MGLTGMVRRLAADRWMRSFGSLAAGEALSGVLRLLSLVIVARVLGPSAFGTVGVGLAVGTYLLVCHSGIEVVGTRAAAAQAGHVTRVASQVVGTRLAISAVVYLVMVVGLFVVPLDAGTRIVIAIFALGLFTSSANVRWLFVSDQRTFVVAAASVCAAAVNLGLVFVLVRTHDEMVLVPIIQIGSEVLLVLVLLLVSRSRFGAWHPRFDLSSMLRLFRQGFPITITKAAKGFVLAIDVVLVLALVSAEAAGQYSAPRRLTFAVTIFLSVYFETALPSFVHARMASAHELARLLRLATRRATQVLVPLAIVATIGAPFIISALGPAYESSTLVLQILVWGVVMMALSGPVNQALWALGKERPVAILAIVAGVATLVLDIALLPILGAPGAAIGDLVGRIVFLALSFVVLRSLMRERSPGHDISLDDDTVAGADPVPGRDITLGAVSKLDAPPDV